MGYKFFRRSPEQGVRPRKVKAADRIGWEKPYLWDVETSLLRTAFRVDYGQSGRYQIGDSCSKARRNYHVFITHALFGVSISSCDADHNFRISMKRNWRKRVRVESAHRGNSNTLASSRWHIKLSFRYRPVGTAGKQQGGTGNSYWPKIVPIKLPWGRFGNRLLFNGNIRAFSWQYEQPANTLGTGL